MLLSVEEEELEEEEEDEEEEEEETAPGGRGGGGGGGHCLTATFQAHRFLKCSAMQRRGWTVT